MSGLECYTLDGASGRQVALPGEWFDVDINRNAMYQAIKAQRTNSRAGTASTKTRAEVRGSSAKPWRQKGTGRARAGSTRSPLWEGGGVIHGPRPKRWKERLPQRVKQIAFTSALTERAQNGCVRLVELDAFEAPKTARLARAIERWDVEGSKVLLLTAESDTNLFLSGRNLPRVTVKRFADASAYDVLTHGVIVVEEGAWDTRGGESAPSVKSEEQAQDEIDG